MQDYGVNFGGTLIEGKSSFALSVNGGGNYSAPTYRQRRPAGTPRRDAADQAEPRQPVLYGSLDYALTKDQTLRMTFDFNRFNVAEPRHRPVR